MEKKFTYFVYIMTNQIHTVLYTGVTNNIYERVNQHKNKTTEGFTKKYNANMLVYMEEFDSIYNAIQREKQIKGGSRKKKIELIESMNREWKDLSDGWYSD